MSRGSSSAGRRSPRSLAVGGFGALTLVVLASCGVPAGQDSFTQIGTDEVPFRLAEQSTTTSTSEPPATTSPPTTQLDAPSTTVEETTTTLPLETVEIYFLSRGELQPVPRELPQAYGINQLAAGLEAGPPLGAAGVGLDTLIEEGLILDSATESGVVTVELDEVEFDEIQPRDQRPAIAQIVLTYTTNLRGVGQVTFTIAGEPIRVPTGNGLLSDPGQPLAFDDYANMLADRPAGEDDPEAPPEVFDSEPPADENVGDLNATSLPVNEP